MNPTRDRTPPNEPDHFGRALDAWGRAEAHDAADRLHAAGPPATVASAIARAAALRLAVAVSAAVALLVLAAAALLWILLTAVDFEPAQPRPDDPTHITAPDR